MLQFKSWCSLWGPFQDTAMQAGEFQEFFDRISTDGPVGMNGPCATYRLYKTVDGYIFLSCQDDNSFKRACIALGLDTLSRKYSDFKLRETNDKIIAEEFENVIGELETDEVLNVLTSVEVECSASSHTINIHSDIHAIKTGVSVESQTFVGAVKHMGTPFIFDSNGPKELNNDEYNSKPELSAFIEFFLTEGSQYVSEVGYVPIGADNYAKELSKLE